MVVSLGICFVVSEFFYLLCFDVNMTITSRLPFVSILTKESSNLCSVVLQLDVKLEQCRLHYLQDITEWEFFTVSFHFVDAPWAHRKLRIFEVSFCIWIISQFRNVSLVDLLKKRHEFLFRIKNSLFFWREIFRLILCLNLTISLCQEVLTWWELFMRTDRDTAFM